MRQRELERQTSIGEYDVADDVSPVGPRPPTEAIDLLDYASEAAAHTLDRDLLPSIQGYDWEALPVQKGPAEVLEWWKSSPPSRIGGADRPEPESIPGKGGIVVKGAEEYLRRHALADLPVPEYYARLESRSPNYRWSVDGRLLVTRRLLRRCLRLVNGKGQINSDAIDIVLCDTGSIMVCGSRGLFLVPIPVTNMNVGERKLPDPPAAVKTEVEGLTVPEENPELQAGLARWVKLLEESEYPSAEEYESFIAEGTGNTSHRIRRADEGTVKLTAEELQIMVGQDQSADAVSGIHKRTLSERLDTDKAGHLFTAVVDDIPGPIGTEQTVNTESKPRKDGADTITGTIVGYQTKWDVWKRVWGFSGRKKPSKLVFKIQIGVLKPTGEVAVVSRNAAEFDLRD